MNPRPPKAACSPRAVARPLATSPSHGTARPSLGTNLPNPGRRSTKRSQKTSQRVAAQAPPGCQALPLSFPRATPAGFEISPAKPRAAEPPSPARPGGRRSRERGFGAIILASSPTRTPRGASVCWGLTAIPSFPAPWWEPKRGGSLPPSRPVSPQHQGRGTWGAPPASPPAPAST